jgi:hypothetical protein
MVRYSQKNKKKVAKKQSFKKKRVGGDDAGENTKRDDASGDEPKDEQKDEAQPNEYDSWVQSLVEAKDDTSVKNALKVLYIDKHSIERIVTNVGHGDAFVTKYEVGSQGEGSLEGVVGASDAGADATDADAADADADADAADADADADAADADADATDADAADADAADADATSLHTISQEGGKSINGTNACWINAPVYAFAAHPSLLSLVETNGGALGAKVSAMSKDVGLWNDDSYEALLDIMSTDSSSKLPDTLGEYNDAHLPMLALLRASSSEPLDAKDDDFGAPPLTDSVRTSALKLVSSTSFPSVSDDQKLVSIVVSACMDLNKADADHFVVHVLNGETGLYYEFDALQGGLLKEGRDYAALQGVLSDCVDGKGRHYLSLYA